MPLLHKTFSDDDDGCSKGTGLKSLLMGCEDVLCNPIINSTLYSQIYIHNILFQVQQKDFLFMENKHSIDIGNS